MTDREIKALHIAAKSKLTRKGNLWTVPSQTRHGEYHFNPDPESPNCTCPDHEFTQARCKHIFAVEYVIEREQMADGQTVVTETVKVTRKTYTQNWPAYNAAQTEEKSRLHALLYERAGRFLSPSNGAEGRVYRWLTSSLPARSRSTQLFQAVAVNWGFAFLMVIKWKLFILPKKSASARSVTLVVTVVMDGGCWAFF